MELDEILAHPNQIYLLTRLRHALKRDEYFSLDWPARHHLPALGAAGQTRALDLLTAS